MNHDGPWMTVEDIDGFGFVAKSGHTQVARDILIVRMHWGLAFFFFLNSLAMFIWARHEEGNTIVVTEAGTEDAHAGIAVAMVAGAALLLTSLCHVANATFLCQYWQPMVTKHYNVYRWLERSIIDALVVLGLGLLCRMNDISALLALMMMVFLMMHLVLVAERNNMPSLLAVTWIGLAFIYGMLMYHLAQASVHTSTPLTIWILLAITFVLYNLVGVLVYIKCTTALSMNWELMFITLNVIGLTFFAWLPYDVLF